MTGISSYTSTTGSRGFAGASGAPAASGPPLLAPFSNEEAWEALPPVESGHGAPLPSWARMLARSLPRTAAALLELDLAQRTKSPLDPKLRAAMRWVAANANGSPYGMACAVFDARLAGLDETKIAAMEKYDVSSFSPEQRSALEFARKMTVASSKVTDEEFATLVAAYGETRAAAMVLLMAYANFQDRLLIVLGAPIEEGGPMPVAEVSFKAESLSPHSAPAAPPEIPDLPEPAGSGAMVDDPDWAAFRYEDLQRKLEDQRAKPTRLRVPDAEEVLKGLPDGATMHGTRVVWSLVAFGYCPELAQPWETLMWVNGEENGRRFDRVFGLGLFWIVTRTIDCPYCMGHVEMNWEVIGMTPEQIAARSRALAGRDWSSFPAAEQGVFAFARKLTATPAGVTREEIDGVVRDFGLDATVSILTYACRCNYMVRVSNGFQLSLERDNVFFDYYKVKPPGPASAKPGP